MQRGDIPGLVDRLAAHRTLSAAPRNELEWLAAHGTVRRYEVGEMVASVGEPIVELFVVLSGRVTIRVDRGGARRKVMEWRSGDITGLLPYSRMGLPPGDSVAEEPAEALSIHRRHFPALIRDCPELTAILVHIMLDRARVFNASDLLVERMVSLGKLSAGLAHELNNPASAASRSAKLLAAGLADADRAARALGAASLSPSQVAAVDRVRDVCLAAPIISSESPIERADREDAIASWLGAHGADAAAAPALADTAVTPGDLDALAGALDGEALLAALRWIAAGCHTRALALEIEKASSRIYHLVSAVKGFTYMDRAAVPEPVDIGRGLSDTITVLGAKARAKSVAVTVKLEPDLPPVRGFGGELNQVWNNLLDNALDAAPPAGHVDVTARREGGMVVVCVTDDGPGIPAAVRNRIFDPFFTTKPIGHGTGLGLDIAQRHIRAHEGEIDVDSVPGRTEFRVSLPVLAESAAPPESR